MCQPGCPVRAVSQAPGRFREPGVAGVGGGGGAGISAAKRCGKSAWLTRPELSVSSFVVPRVSQTAELFAADLLIGVLVTLREELRHDGATLSTAAAKPAAAWRAAGARRRPPPAGASVEGRF